MAVDAKIGSLIGLALIFVIALVINGMLRSDAATDSGTPSAATADNMPGIGARERRLVNGPAAVRRADQPPAENRRDTGSLASRPGTEPAAAEPTTDAGSNGPELDAVKRSLATVYYAVCEGDNLADIAKKFYGPEGGNRRANILRIFEANRNLLRSPHKIYVGQKLVIPPLTASGPDESILSSSMFEADTSIGRKHLSTNEREAGQSYQYTVQEGDSLWAIADALLGDCRRYKEISRLNAGILTDEDRLAVGMRLRIPAR